MQLVLLNIRFEELTLFRPASSRSFWRIVAKAEFQSASSERGDFETETTGVTLLLSRRTWADDDEAGKLKVFEINIRTKSRHGSVTQLAVDKEHIR